MIRSAFSRLTYFETRILFKLTPKYARTHRSLSEMVALASVVSTYFVAFAGVSHLYNASHKAMTWLAKPYVE